MMGEEHRPISAQQGDVLVYEQTYRGKIQDIHYDYSSINAIPARGGCVRERSCAGDGAGDCADDRGTRFASDFCLRGWVGERVGKLVVEYDD